MRLRRAKRTTPKPTESTLTPAFRRPGHACSRCPFLRVDPAQLPRIEEMTDNAELRLAEAQNGAWLGEVAALGESLKHLRQRRAEAETQLSVGVVHPG
jgi:hypothetical protein